MSILLLAALISLAELPPWTFPDTEVTTNVVHNFANPSASELRFTIEAEASPSNNFIISMGKGMDFNIFSDAQSFPITPFVINLH